MPTEARKSGAAEWKRRQYLLQVVREGSGIVQNAYVEACLEWPPESNNLSFEELKMLAYKDQSASEAERGQCSSRLAVRAKRNQRCSKSSRKLKEIKKGSKNRAMR